MYSGKYEGKPKCPSCGKLLDGFTVDGPEARPDPGDFSVCFYCCQPLQFTKDVNVMIPVDVRKLSGKQRQLVERMVRGLKAAKKFQMRMN